MCAKPFRQGVAEFGCGQCLPCRINRRRTWAARLMLEATQHEHSLFVTLTYASEWLPAGGTLVPRDVQLYLKRLREEVAPVRIRFYAVGEYGKRLSRPHYHLMLYGLPLGAFADHVVPAEVARVQKACVCVVCRCWKRGYVDIGRVEPDSCAYVTQYVVKKWTKFEDSRLGGRHPEFCRMSLRPGIGAGAMAVVGEALQTYHGSKVLARDGDVPNALAQGQKSMPLGRYLRRKLREYVGIDKKFYVRGSAPLDVGLLQRQFELRQPGGPALREGKRLQSLRKAEALRRIHDSKESKL